MSEQHDSPVRKLSKGFKQYFLEGIMIFVAISFGFFADNLREDRSEKNKALDLVRSLKDDIKTDTTRLNSLIQFELTRIALTDSLHNLLSEPLETIDQRTYYRLLINCMWGSVFTPTDKSRTQLKDGYLYLLKDNQLESAFATYDSLFADYKATETLVMHTDYEPYVMAMKEYSDPKLFSKAADLKISDSQLEFSLHPIEDKKGIMITKEGGVQVLQNELIQKKFFAKVFIITYNHIKRSHKRTLEHLDNKYP